MKIDINFCCSNKLLQSAPRLMVAEFHSKQRPATEMSEWTTIGHNTVLDTFVGFAKFYTETRGEIPT